MAEIGKTIAGYNPEIGTEVTQIPKLLRTQGVGANTYANTPDTVQIGIENGQGVLSNHDSGLLWRGESDELAHAVHVTDVVKNGEGTVTHYVINDTGTGEAGRKVPAGLFERSLMPPEGKNYAVLTDGQISLGGRTASQARIKAQREYIEQLKAAEQKASAPSQKSEEVGSSVGSKDKSQSAQPSGKDSNKVATQAEPDTISKAKETEIEAERNVPKTLDLSKRTDAQLKEDIQKKPRIGETEVQMQQRVEAAYKETAQRLERADGGHSLDRHGPDVTDAQLDQRLKTGIAPDGQFSPAPASTKFNSNENWVKTREIALKEIEKKFGIDLSKPPNTQNPKPLDIKIGFDQPIDEGFVPDLTTSSKVKITDPTTGKTKKGNVFSSTNPVNEVTGTYTRVIWNGQKWVVVQHFPLAEGWKNTSKIYSSPDSLDAIVPLQ
jgi:hypothetical protein